nr:MAG TPA: glycoprotein [Caudoviricetes sp.]
MNIKFIFLRFFILCYFISIIIITRVYFTCYPNCFFPIFSPNL